MSFIHPATDFFSPCIHRSPPPADTIGHLQLPPGRLSLQLSDVVFGSKDTDRRNRTTYPFSRVRPSFLSTYGSTIETTNITANRTTIKTTYRTACTTTYITTYTTGTCVQHTNNCLFGNAGFCEIPRDFPQYPTLSNKTYSILTHTSSHITRISFS